MNNLFQEKEIFQTTLEWAQFRQTGQGKKHVTLTQNSNQHVNVINDSKSFHKTFPTKVRFMEEQLIFLESDKIDLLKLLNWV